MKKTLMAGAASLALAAMPVVGTFAAQQSVTITDTLQVTITTACTFVRYGAAGASQTDVNPGPNWSGTTTADGDTVTGTYSATVKPSADVELGTSTFTAFCNAADGYNVTVSTPNLTNSVSGGGTIDFTSTEPTSSEQGWTLTKGNSLFSSGSFMSSNTATTAAQHETATYTVYTSATTRAGTYTGNVVYTFTYNDPA